ncbi:phosphopantetheine-binding protein [Streptomyces sp. NPDC127039]|uniref:phosphopantetheine-binding protein n=1 Tax=Streptomyces sp. NPDC127039 TaxID=3347115 RepID=UPI003663EEF3
MTDTPGARTDFTVERLRQDVAELLYVDADDVPADESVFDHGLDSVRMMALVQRWRADGAAEVDLPQLAQRPTLTDWAALLAPAGAPRAGA